MSIELETPEAPVELPDPDLSVGDFEKLTALMDDNGALPDHSDATIQREQEEPETVPSKEPVSGKQADASKEGDAPKPAETQQAEAVEVEYEGRKYTVPTELKDALLRHSDYTRKVQEVAVERQSVQQERQATQAFVQEAQQMVGVYAALQQIDAQMQQLPALYQQAMAAGQELRAVELRQTASELAQTRGMLVGQLEQARSARTQAEMQAFAQAAEAGHKALATEIKDWGAEKQRALADLAHGLGYRPEELSRVVDPRGVRMLNMIYELQRENAGLKGQQTAAQKQIRQAPPKPVRASSVQEPADDLPSASKELARLRRSGSDDDALAALRALGIE